MRQGYRFFSLLIAGLVCHLLAAPTASAQPAEKVKPVTCADKEAFHAFDFWIGTFDVTGWTEGKPVARNAVRAVENHCLLLEHWVGNDGSSGRSMTYYNPVTEKWRQIWIAAQSFLIDVSGGWEDGAMRQSGEIWYYGPGINRPFRGVWTPRENGVVRQRFEEKGGNGKGWQPWYDARYTPNDAKGRINEPPTPGQSDAEGKPVTCADKEAFHAFDFWIGTFDVTDWKDGSHQGRNTIRAMENHCLLMERWTGDGGSSGRSMSYYNPVSGEWRQVWVSAQSYAIDISGGWQDGAMRLTGDIWYYKSGKRHPFRGIWKPQENGTVRQRFEQKTDGENWEVWFDGRYTPAEDTAQATGAPDSAPSKAGTPGNGATQGSR